MIEDLVKYDNNFNEANFKSYVDNIFVKLFTAIMLDELDTVKHFLSEEIYKKYNLILDNLKTQNMIQMYDELNVKSSEIVDVSITDDKFTVKVKLISRYMDYVIDKNNGTLIKGNNTSRIMKTYLLTLEKRRDYISQNNIRKCPGCGASIDVNGNGKCAYCDTIYNLDKHDYILTDIQNYD